MPSPTPIVAALLSAPVAGEPDEMGAARRFLDGGAVPSGALSATITEALCDALVARGDAARLAELASSRDRALAKQARRGLHALRSRGVAAEIPVAAARASAPAAAPPALDSLVSAVIRDGERLLWYVRAISDGVEVHQARATELEGLTRYDVAQPTRREWRDAEHELLADPVLSVTRVPAAYARWLLEESHQRAVAAGRTPPRRYAEVRHLLDRPLTPARHPVLDVTDGIAPHGPLARVLDLPETRSWIPDEELARKAYLEIEVSATSQLVIEPRQRAEQMAEILRRTCGEALSGPWRARLERRLLDTAFLIAHLVARPQHDRARDHLADAALCVAAAAQVADVAVAPDDVVVARGLFERLLPKEPPSTAPEAPPTSGLIITP